MAMTLTPLVSTLGYEVHGLDLTKPLADADRTILGTKFEEDGLLLFRGVDFSADDQRRLGEAFGEVRVRHGIATSVPVADEGTQYISNARADGILGNGELTFHQDHLYYDEPLKGLMLYGMTIPTSGSSTKFRSCTAIYDVLDRKTAARADAVQCLHAFDFEGDYEKGVDPYNMSANSSRAWHPLLWRRDPDARPAVWVSDWNVVDFEGIDPEDGQSLLKNVWDQAEAVEEYVHDWAVGDLLLWNNLMVQHARMPFDTAEPRTLRRTPILS